MHPTPIYDLVNLVKSKIKPTLVYWTRWNINLGLPKYMNTFIQSNWECLMKLESEL